MGHDKICRVCESITNFASCGTYWKKRVVTFSGTFFLDIIGHPETEREAIIVTCRICNFKGAIQLFKALQCIHFFCIKCLLTLKRILRNHKCPLCDKIDNRSVTDMDNVSMVEDIGLIEEDNNNDAIYFEGVNNMEESIQIRRAKTIR